MDDNRIDYLTTAADIVCAYVSNNSIPTTELTGLIASVHATLANLQSGAGAAPATETFEKASPAQIRKSVSPDALISFLDGKSYKTLKRHLTTHGIDPHTYRQRYGLPSDYPMVAANYAAQRSALAKSIGLGRPGSQAKAQEAPAKTGRARPKAVPVTETAPETTVRAAARRARKDPSKAAA